MFFGGRFMSAVVLALSLACRSIVLLFDCSKLILCWSESRSPLLTTVWRKRLWLFRDNRQQDMRSARRVVVNRLDGLSQLGILPKWMARVGIAVVLGKIAARDLDADSVALTEEIACGPEVDQVF